MLYQLSFEIVFVAIRKNSQSQFYYFESDLKPNEFSDLIFRFEPLMPRTVRITSNPTYSDCVIGFVDFQEENEIDIDPTHFEMLEYLRQNLVESVVTHHLVPPNVYGTVISFEIPIEKMFDPSFELQLTSEHFEIVDEYRVYDHIQIGASGLFEYIVQNLNEIKNLAQILYYFIKTVKVFGDLTSAEKVQIPAEQKKNHKLIRYSNLRLAVADTLNIDFNNVQILVFDAQLHGPYMRVSTNLGMFEVMFDTNDELIFISPFRH